MNLANLTKNDYKIDFIAGETVDIRLGLGMDMTDPLFPKPRAYGFARAATQAATGVITQDDLLQQQSFYLEVSTYEEEQRRLSINFSGRYSLVSASMAYEQAKREISSKFINYLDISRFGEGEALSNMQALEWASRPAAENIKDDEELLAQFLLDYGSHFVTRLYNGFRVVVRATLKKSSNQTYEKFSAAVKAMGGAWGASGGVSAEHQRTLSQTDTELMCVVVCGGMNEPSRVFAIGFESIQQLFSDLKNGTLTITPGPIKADLTTYWHKLLPFPRCRHALRQQSGVIATSPFGVPKGTVIAWSPPAENMTFGSDQAVVGFVIPDGWAVCNGQSGTPDLTNRFVMGTSAPTEVNISGGSSRHSHSLKTAREYIAKPGFSHSYVSEQNTEEAEHLPPHTRLVFLIKL